MVALNACVLLRRFFQQRKGRQLKFAVGFEFVEIEMSLLDFLRLGFFGRRLGFFDDRRQFFFNFQTGEKAGKKSKNPVFERFENATG